MAMYDQNNPQSTTDFEAAYRAGIARGQIDEFGRMLVLPEGYKVEDTERFDAVPRRIRSTVQAITLDAFLDYFNEFSQPESTIFADPRTGALTGVLDYHGGPLNAAWGDHRVKFAPVSSPEWKAWSSNQHAMGQFDFCEFIEDHVDDIVTPTGAEVLEAASNMKAQRKVEFASKVDVHNGNVIFKYASETKGNGQVQMPESFTIGVPPFEGTDRFAIEARLRYRIADDGEELKLWYTLVRPEDAVREVVDQMVQRVREDAQTERVYLASPPAATSALR